MNLLQSASGLQHLNERLGTDNREKPQKTSDPTQFLSDNPSVHHYVLPAVSEAKHSMKTFLHFSLC